MVAAVFLLIVAIAMTLDKAPRPIVVWNASASVPKGLYWITRPVRLGVGTMVVARLPMHWRMLADARGYLPSRIPLVKRIAAISGDHICATDDAIIIDGRWRDERQSMDLRGRLMPVWSGCITLPADAVFLLGDDPASFDGRYFGITLRRDIIGRASPLWTR